MTLADIRARAKQWDRVDGGRPTNSGQAARDRRDLLVVVEAAIVFVYCPVASNLRLLEEALRNLGHEVER
jgi:hypothetical protein